MTRCRSRSRIRRPHLYHWAAVVVVVSCAAPGRAAPGSPAPPASTAATAATAAVVAGNEELARWVNPFIGTLHGETWPGADVPFGMLQWSPENTRGQQMRSARPGGYAWDASRIRGFALTHMSGTGCAGAYGDIPFLPFPGAVTSSPSSDVQDDVYASSFS